MVQVTWSGNVVTVNNWHGIRTNKHGGKYISAKREYEQFVEELTVSILVTARRELLKVPRVNMLMRWSLGPLVDDQNLLKPVCDAIEHAGVVENDRNIALKIIVPAERHKTGELDGMELLLSEDWKDIAIEACRIYGVDGRIDDMGWVV